MSAANRAKTHVVALDAVRRTVQHLSSAIQDLQRRMSVTMRRLPGASAQARPLFSTALIQAGVQLGMLRDRLRMAQREGLALRSRIAEELRGARLDEARQKKQNAATKAELGKVLKRSKLFKLGAPQKKVMNAVRKAVPDIALPLRLLLARALRKKK